MSRSLAVLTLLLTMSCATQGVRTGLTADGNPRLRMWRVDLRDGSLATEIWAKNESKVDLILSELLLSNCRNLFQRCGSYPVNLTIEAGREVRVAQLESSGGSQHASFGYTSRWRWLGTPPAMADTSVRVAAGSPPPAPRVLVAGPAGRRQIAELTLAEFIPIVDATDGDARCGTSMPTGGGAGGRMYTLHIGGVRATLGRIISVTVNSEGQPVRLMDTRGDLRVPPPGVPAQQVVSDPGPRTTIQIDIENSIAMLMNQPPDAEATQGYVQDEGLLQAESLDVPSRWIERVLRECVPE